MLSRLVLISLCLCCLGLTCPPQNEEVEDVEWDCEPATEMYLDYWNECQGYDVQTSPEVVEGLCEYEDWIDDLDFDAIGDCLSQSESCEEAESCMWGEDNGTVTVVIEP